ncbi:glycosyltransferase [Rhodococcus sp. G-MC3]|uniref:glycosyltransferase n=1 Tax=Rhodococcus sp. G-MC3 TaxID=3046209 RepID=UPI0024B8A43D|nr:glycosyltransferase [Rhodococcus sp. G-MC3]MDJ0392281.1 glycosyltransferase [Rhodococcus sp. G-MC3]
MTISLVSVIIPVYNGVPHLETQLAALAAQDYTGEFEVIVSDNGSTDGTREYVSHAASPFPLRWVDASATRGVSYARNVGIDASEGEFLAVTDHDDAVHPGWLTALTREAENYDAVGGSIEVHSLNSSEVALWRTIPRPEQRFGSYYLPWAHGNNFAFWRRVVDEVGYFDEDLIGGGEDVDYSWRIQEAGMTLGHVPDAVVAYRLRTTVRASFRQGSNYGGTACMLTRKHHSLGCPDPSHFLQIPAHLATIAYLATIRNPWLPGWLNPPPRGLWAHHIGLQHGALTMRLHFLDPRTPHRRRSSGMIAS